MTEAKLLAKSIYKRLQGEDLSDYQAIVISYDLFTLTFALEQSAEYDEQDLVSLFLDKLKSCDLEDLMEQNEEYAIRISDFDGELEYEEMHKLFSLCDEVYMLECLGLDSEKELKSKFEQSVRQRLKREERKARLVAEDRFEEWKSKLWWYNNLVS